MAPPESVKKQEKYIDVPGQVQTLPKSVHVRDAKHRIQHAWPYLLGFPDRPIVAILGNEVLIV
jgi:hypothetical protein